MDQSGQPEVLEAADVDLVDELYSRLRSIDCQNH